MKYPGIECTGQLDDVASVLHKGNINIWIAQNGLFANKFDNDLINSGLYDIIPSKLINIVC